MWTLEAQARRLKGAGSKFLKGADGKILKGAGGTSLNNRIPRLWLLSDPRRLPDPLPAAARLPPGSAGLARGLAPAGLCGLARWISTSR